MKCCTCAAAAASLLLLVDQAGFLLNLNRAGIEPQRWCWCHCVGEERTEEWGGGVPRFMQRL